MASEAGQSGTFRSRRQEDPPGQGPPKTARQEYTARPCPKREKKIAGKCFLVIMYYILLYTDQCLVGHKNQCSESQIILKGTQETERPVPQKC